jgi:RNA polymerase sigma-70 factor (ECF subfamily)
MLEDKLLVWKFKHGSSDALRQIYEKYKNDLLSLAIALSPDRATAEDAVHDVFVSFAQFADRLQLRGSLKSYLSSCVANRVRNIRKASGRQTMQLDATEIAEADSNRPDRLAISAEQTRQVSRAMGQLPCDQREVIILHLQGEMKFKEIAESEGVSLNTIQSRYRYGLDKLRSLLNGEIEK